MKHRTGEGIWELRTLLAQHVACPGVLITVGAVSAAAERLGEALHMRVVPWLVRELTTDSGRTVGAVAEGGGYFLDFVGLARTRLSLGRLDELLATYRSELDGDAERLRTPDGLPSLADRVVVLLDDGESSVLAIRAVLLGLRRQHPRRLIRVCLGSRKVPGPLIEDEVFRIVARATPHEGAG